MNKTLFIVISTLILSQCVVNARFRITQQQTLKNSKPFLEILNRAKVLMGTDNQNKIQSKIVELKEKSQQEIVDYFVKYDYKGDPKEYWLQYYLLANIVLFSDKTWTKPTMDKINDTLYDEILAKEQEYQSSMNTCKRSSNLFLSERSPADLNLGESGTLYNFDYSYQTLELIEKDQFFKHISKNLPKGIIHHIHWSAATDYLGFYKSISNYLGSLTQDGERYVVVSVQLYLEDVTVGKKITEKYFTKYFLTKQKFVDPKTVQSLTDKYAEEINKFKINVMEDGKCLNYIKDNSGFNPSSLDSDLRGFLYWKNCKGDIYDEQMNKQNQSKSLLDLKNLLKNTVACFLPDEQAIKKLPKAYLNDNINESKEIKEILGVWVNFELIFQSLGEFTDNKEIFKQLTSNLFKNAKDQNISGIEFRNKDDPFQIENFNENSQSTNIPFSYITPGRKVSGSGSKGTSIVDKAKASKNPNFVGIDFFAFEDDPYNGARNFFPSSFTEVLKGQSSSQFDQMFSYLSDNGSMYLHAGETIFFPGEKITEEFASKNYINDNLFHAALLPGIKRTGHGFEAHKNNLILNIFKEKNISLESCPISNQVLNFQEVYSHPFLDMLRSGVHVSISPDDPGLFGYMGVAHDWYYIMMNTNIKPSEIYLLIKNSIEHSSIKYVQQNKQTYLEKAKQDLDAFFSNMKSGCDYTIKDNDINNNKDDDQSKVIDETSGSVMKFIISLCLIFLIF